MTCLIPVAEYLTEVTVKSRVYYGLAFGTVHCRRNGAVADDLLMTAEALVIQCSPGKRERSVGNELELQLQRHAP